MSAQANLVHGWDDAAAALAAATQAESITFVSAPDAGGYAGAAWFMALAARAEREFPRIAQSWVLDCGDAPGHVLAALRAGVRSVVFSGGAGTRARLAAIAAAQGAVILAAAPDLSGGPGA